ncbi:unnamed protein product [Prorocentrum cordatum]|uniref:Uncharacterized protein n=1 Tax=Prorocentrum cordatum TaxID=2364126 RepID=A0ABN9QF13_9DINO|nr:unnamed protein product [Polarella glacialis]
MYDENNATAHSATPHSATPHPATPHHATPLSEHLGQQKPTECQEMECGKLQSIRMLYEFPAVTKTASGYGDSWGFFVRFEPHRAEGASHSCIVLLREGNHLETAPHLENTQPNETRKLLHDQLAHQLAPIRN